MDIVLLDSTPVGILCNPKSTVIVQECRDWLNRLLLNHRRVILPEIIDYEIRREFLLRNSFKSLRLLNQLALKIEYLPLSTPIYQQAAQLWAAARQKGLPTASNASLDIDVILSAQSLGLQTKTIVATSNPAHLSRFTVAELWSNITP